MTKAYFYFARDCQKRSCNIWKMTLKLDKISKRFRDRWILRDFSLEVNPGTIFGLLGGAGSGKSTVLRILSGAEKADSGKIAFDHAREADFKLIPSGENSFSWKSLFKQSKNDEMSDGEKIFAEFEKILEQAENVLLLDNPFACFDPSLREKAIAMLRRKTKEKNLAVIYATADYADAFEICDTIGILHRGEIIQTGTPRELYEQPNSVAAALLLGRNNLIEARRISFNNQPIPEFQTLKGNHRLQTGKTEKRRLGAITQNVTLAIRPEYISISFGASFPEDNLLKAKITEVRFQGATTSLKLDADGLILEALVLRLVGLKEGDECMVGLPPDRISILKD
jgi:ABC-type spermidine/putrescine transport systems, ATPase components